MVGGDCCSRRVVMYSSSEHLWPHSGQSVVWRPRISYLQAGQTILMKPMFRSLSLRSAGVSLMMRMRDVIEQRIAKAVLAVNANSSSIESRAVVAAIATIPHAQEAEDGRPAAGFCACSRVLACAR